MNKFGVIKTKVLKKITESYTNQRKGDLKDIITTIRENRDFKEMYLLYEDIENKYFEDKEIAKLYVEELSSALKAKSAQVSKICESLSKKLRDIDSDENNVYTMLDNLSESDSLLNIEKKVKAKKGLVDFLTKQKESPVVSESVPHTENENLLLTVLASNFNLLYNNALNENERNELKDILSMDEFDLVTKTKELKEGINEKVSTLLQESSTDVDLTNKLSSVQKEVDGMNTTKYNYYRLLQLKDGLN